MEACSGDRLKPRIIPVYGCVDLFTQVIGNPIIVGIMENIRRFLRRFADYFVLNSYKITTKLEKNLRYVLGLCSVAALPQIPVLLSLVG